MDLHVDWTPGIGDPSFMGWFTVAAYFAAAVLSAMTRRAIRDHVPDPDRGRQPAVWGWVTVFMIALCINKQLDLQSWFTAFARVLLKELELTTAHREIQVDFMIGLSGTAALFLVVSAWLVRRRRREYWLLLLGVTFTTTFIVVRAASFHHFDRLLSTRVMGARMNWVLELTGITVIAAAAWIRRRDALRTYTSALDVEP